MLLRQVGGAGIGGVAVQAVAALITPASGAGVFAAGVTPILDLPGDPACRAESFKATDFGRGPALPNRLSQAPAHQPTNARFCRCEDDA